MLAIVNNASNKKGRKWFF